jgi:hypothetical protein
MKNFACILTLLIATITKAKTIEVFGQLPYSIGYGYTSEYSKQSVSIINKIEALLGSDKSNVNIFKFMHFRSEIDTQTLEVKSHYILLEPKATGDSHCRIDLNIITKNKILLNTHANYNCGLRNED